MQFEWPTAEQAIYRVMRLRRLIGLCAMVPFGVLLPVAFADPAFLSMPVATGAVMVIVAAVVAHAVFFPNASLETISLALAATGLVLALPLIGIVAHWAPEAHVTALAVVLAGLAAFAAALLMVILHVMLTALVYAGPCLRLRLKIAALVPCSPQVAFAQCALQPQTRRGRVLTGAADDDGFFDVAVMSTQAADPAQPDQPLIVKVDAKVLSSTPARHDVMLVLPNGSVTVTSVGFTAARGGCLVEVCDLPGDFTAGMHLLFWLTDQQADNLTEMTDVIAGTPARANGLSHATSFLDIAGALFSPREPVADRSR